MKTVDIQTTCTIRKDILKQGLYVWIGTYHACTKNQLPYKWIDGKFCIYYRKRWNAAQSIDFEF